MAAVVAAAEAPGPVATLRHHTCPVTTVAFSGDDTQLVSGYMPVYTHASCGDFLPHSLLHVEAYLIAVLHSLMSLSQSLYGTPACPMCPVPTCGLPASPTRSPRRSREHYAICTVVSPHRSARQTKKTARQTKNSPPKNLKTLGPEAEHIKKHFWATNFVGKLVVPWSEKSFLTGDVKNILKTY